MGVKVAVIGPFRNACNKQINNNFDDIEQIRQDCYRIPSENILSLSYENGSTFALAICVRMKPSSNEPTSNTILIGWMEVALHS